METIDSDYLIVGSGIAGLMSAIYLAEESTRKILLITKKKADDSNSSKAQGGIACVMEPGDTFESHIADTLDAGAGLCDIDAVRKIVEAGPERIADLEKFGVVFDKGDSKSGYALGREGGPTQRRILHAGDITGREVEAVLIDYVKKLPNVTIMENVCLIDLVTTRKLARKGKHLGELSREEFRDMMREAEGK